MAAQTTPVPLTVIAAIPERERQVRLESRRDFMGVAVGVVAGGLIWLGFLAFVRLPG